MMVFTRTAINRLHGRARAGLKVAAATALAAAGRAGERLLKRAMLLYAEAGQKEKAIAVAGQLAHRAGEDPDVAFILFPAVVKRFEEVKPNRDSMRVCESMQEALLASDNVAYIRLALTIPFVDHGNDSRYALLQQAAQVLEGREGTRVVRSFLSAQLIMWALMRSDYPAARRYLADVDAELRKGHHGIVGMVPGFFLFHWSGNEQLARHAISNTTRPRPYARAERRAMAHQWDDDKIRIGYVSADFFDANATMKLIGNVLKRHNRERFDITLFCNTPDHALAINKFDRSNWGHIIDIKQMSDEEVVACIKERSIDILVDLKGYTDGNRVCIFNEASAPVHAAWIGYPTTAVNVDLDYVIGDPIVLPDSAQADWDEVFCRLPETYQPNDPVHRPRISPMARGEVGLPADRFIYASCNHPKKITPRVMDLWCQILRRTPDSVLWLFVRSETEVKPETQWTNLLREFARQGISEERILMMPFETDYARHLNRLQLADLGLDTFPCNGHTTTSEQLWAGLPVLTVKGTHFASRVSESLLNAIGLPELVAADDAAYVEAAVALYHDREQLARYRQSLEEGRFTKPLFDAERFCRHLETAYTMMVARARAGLEPDVIDVPPLPPREGSFEGL